MDPQQFSQKIKAKYPQYENMDDFELAQKMVAKFPQYASQVNFGQGAPTAAGADEVADGFLGGVGRKLKDFGRRALSVGTFGVSELARPAEEREATAQIGVGAVKGLGSSLLGAGELVSKGASKLTGGFLGDKEQQTIGEAKEKIQPETGLEKAGFFGEQVAEFFVPGTGASKLATTIQKGKNVGQNLIKLGLKPETAQKFAVVGPELATRAIGSAGVISAQEGEVGNEAAIAGLAEIMLPGAVKVLKPLLATVGRVVKGLGSGLSGEPVQVLTQIVDDPRKAREVARLFDAGQGEEILEQSSKTIIDGISRIKSEARQRFGQALNALEATDINPATFRKNTQQILDKYRVSQEAGERVLSGVEFDDPRNIQKASDLIDRLQTVGLDGKSLRKLADDIENAKFKTATGDERLSFNKFIGDLSDSLKKSISQSTDVLTDANKQFSDDMQLAEAMEQIFGKVKFKNMSEYIRAADRLEQLFKQKGIRPEKIDGFLQRIDVDPTEFRTQEAVRQISVTEGPGAGGEGVTLGGILRAVTGGVLTPKLIRDLSITTGIAKETLEPIMKELSPAARGLFIKAITETER